MTGLERALASIRGEKTDCRATFLHNFQMGAQRSGMDFGRYYLDGEKTAEVVLAMQKEFGNDVILQENGTAALAEALGASVVYRRDQPPVDNQVLLEKIEDVGRLPEKIDFYQKPATSASLKATAILADRLGDAALLMGRGDQGPFSLAGLLLGMDNLMMELAAGEKEEELHQLLEYCADISAAYCVAQIRAGAQATSIGESPAGPDMISPAMYRKYALPYEKKVIQKVHQAGGLISLHICGNADAILADMAQTGADMLEIDQKSSLRLAREVQQKYPVCILGNISPERLRNGTSAEIRELTGAALDIFQGEPRYILGPGCAMASDTPEANVTAMLDAARMGKFE
ncbi:MAG TPA: uroporphyrinogen decarboxylase family protein [Candidatus Scatomonas pullistercoris]|uniref:Uroporphyrinogen decarboxylase family protein n=1 Tax=Candidatus Scatomonas pullistercoris TaxID=2840920 RepID=A0A9D1P2U0_9FIRM|nr:uroporphyrinogen decarboxylase family protein [Candidatus Scatomonas pullistercoris]